MNKDKTLEIISKSYGVQIIHNGEEFNIKNIDYYQLFLGGFSEGKKDSELELNFSSPKSWAENRFLIGRLRKITSSDIEFFFPSRHKREDVRINGEEENLEWTYSLKFDPSYKILH